MHCTHLDVPLGMHHRYDPGRALVAQQCPSSHARLAAIVKASKRNVARLHQVFEQDNVRIDHLWLWCKQAPNQGKAEEAHQACCCERRR